MKACVLCCENKIDLQRIDQILKVSREEIEKGDFESIQVSTDFAHGIMDSSRKMINLKICCQKLWNGLSKRRLVMKKSRKKISERA